MSEIRVVAIGGSTRPESSSEQVLRVAARSAQEAGAHVQVISSRDLMLPIYDTETQERDARARTLVEAVRSADGLIICSPGYHGGISGMLKNALDYTEDLRDDDPAYLDGRAIGCIAVAYGWQATVSTLQQLRQVAHALRGWPTPLGGVVNASVTQVRHDGSISDETTHEQIRAVGRQVVEFARMRAAHDALYTART
jgi:FMN reductase